MNSQSVKAIIIEDDLEQVKCIKKVLPDYFTFENIRYAEVTEKLKTEPGFTTIAIMNADDKAGRSLKAYKYMKEESEYSSLSYMPVVLYTNDQFSDEAFAFYDYGDPFFHEGEIDETEFFSVVSEAVESAEDIAYEQILKVQEVSKAKDEEPKPEVVMDAISADKLMGKSFDISTEDMEVLRIVAYNHPEVLKAINQATDNTAEKAKIVKAVIDEISHEEESKNKASGIIFEEKKNTPNIHNITDPARVGILLSDEDDDLIIGKNSGGITNIPKVFGENAKSKADSVRNAIRQKLNAQNNAKNANESADKNDGTQKEKKTRILIVDSDPMTLKACKLFLGDAYDIEGVESNMKAIDFFIKDSADIVLIEQDMPFMKGTKILQSILLQKNAKNVRAAIFVNEKMSEVDKDEILFTIGVRTIVTKPIVKKQLIQAVNRCMAQF